MRHSELLLEYVESADHLYNGNHEHYMQYIIEQPFQHLQPQSVHYRVDDKLEEKIYID